MNKTRKAGWTRHFRVPGWLARRAAAGVAVVIVAVDVIGIVLPQLQTLRELQREVEGLTAQRSALASRNGGRLQPPLEAAKAEPEVLKARELVPEISLLGRRSGLRIRTIKQSADSAGRGARQIRVLAQGEFPALIAFVEAISSSLPHGQVEELSVRHLTDAGALEVESTLRVPVAEPPAMGPGKLEEDGSR